MESFGGGQRADPQPDSRMKVMVSQLSNVSSELEEVGSQKLLEVVKGDADGEVTVSL